MPTEFDPGWEYYTPDPELCEDEDDTPVRSLADARIDQRYSVRPIPKRIGRGRVPYLTDRVCANELCGKVFRPAKNLNKFCCINCSWANPKRNVRFTGRIVRPVIRAMYLRGDGVTRIARECGTDHKFIRRILNGMGLKPADYADGYVPPGGSDMKREAALALRHQCWPTVDIAAVMGVSVGTVNRWLLKSGAEYKRYVRKAETKPRRRSCPTT